MINTLSHSFFSIHWRSLVTCRVKIFLDIFSNKHRNNNVYVLQLLKELGLFRDNYDVNTELALGMEKLAEQYFDASQSQ